MYYLFDGKTEKRDVSHRMDFGKGRILSLPPVCPINRTTFSPIDSTPARSRRSVRRFSRGIASRLRRSSEMCDYTAMSSRCRGLRTTTNWVSVTGARGALVVEGHITRDMNGHSCIRNGGRFITAKNDAIRIARFPNHVFNHSNEIHRRYRGRGITLGK